MAKGSRGGSPQADGNRNEDTAAARRQQIIERARVFDSLKTFMADVPEGALLELWRQEPEKDHNGVKIKGFVDNVPLGTTAKWIQERCGGGVYRMIARSQVDGTIDAWCDIEVGGNPLPAVPVTSTAVALTHSPKQPATSFDNPETEDDGSREIVPAGGAGSIPPVGASMEKFFLWLIQWKMVETMAQAQSGGTMKLFSMMLPYLTAGNRAGGSLAEQVKPVLELLDVAESRVAERLPLDAGGGGGDDMISQLVKLLPLFVAGNKGGQPAGVRAGNAPARKLVGAPVAEQSSPAEQVQPMDELAVLNLAVSQIATGFTMQPSMEPARLVAVLKTILPLKREDMAALKAKKQVIVDYAQLQMQGELEGAPERVQQFNTYFTQVFDLFTDLS